MFLRAHAHAHAHRHLRAGAGYASRDQRLEWPMSQGCDLAAPPGPALCPRGSGAPTGSDVGGPLRFGLERMLFTVPGLESWACVCLCAHALCAPAATRKGRWILMSLVLRHWSFWNCASAWPQISHLIVGPFWVSPGLYLIPAPQGPCGASHGTDRNPGCQEFWLLPVSPAEYLLDLGIEGWRPGRPEGCESCTPQPFARGSG